MSPIRVVIVLEAATVTGPAKNLMRFCRMAANPQSGLPPVRLSLVTFLRSSGEASNPFIDAARNQGIPIDIVSESSRWDRSVVAGLRRVLMARRADIVQTHAVKSNCVMRFSSLCREFVWIAFHHGYTTEDLRARLYNRFNRWALPAARSVVTVCRPFAREIAGYGIDPDRLEILPNAIEEFEKPPVDSVVALRRELGLSDGVPVWLSAGRFSREKAQMDLIRAAALLRRTHSGLAFRLLLLGDGPERRAVEAASAGLGLTPQCIFGGHQSDVRPYFALATHFVLPSWTEGSPNVILEAMAAGLPIVATNVGGVPETVIDGESALLCEPRAPSALAANMARLLHDPALSARLAAAARCRLPLFSAEAYYRSLVGIYSRLLPTGSLH